MLRSKTYQSDSGDSRVYHKVSKTQGNGVKTALDECDDPIEKKREMDARKRIDLANAVNDDPFGLKGKIS